MIETLGFRGSVLLYTTPIAKSMEILAARTRLTPDECRTVGRENALTLIGLQ